MLRIFILLALGVISFISCSPEAFEATPPAYLRVDKVLLETDYATQGSSHSAVSTAWVYLNDNSIGVYELPFVIPVMAEGEAEISLRPGVTMNGVSSTRSQYPYYEEITATVNFKALDTVLIGGESSLRTAYAPFYTVQIVEDFDATGLNLSPSFRSDTLVIRSSAQGDAFKNPEAPGENNGKAGKIVLEGERDFFELITIENYQLPQTGQSVYIELSYKNDFPFLLGLIANNPGGQNQVETVYIFPSEEYNKIYVNVVNELVSNPSASSFGIFLGGGLPDNQQSGTLWLDNVKLLY